MKQTDERTLVSFDWAMKNILREKANFDVLEGFLSTLLGEEIQSKNIQAARQKLQLLHMNAEERAAYEQFQMSRASALDVLAGQFKEGMEQGIEIGKGQGIEIGKNKAQRENVRRMRNKGYDLTEIMEITGLSEAEIRFL